MTIQVIFYKELPQQTKVRRIKRIPVRQLGFSKFVPVRTTKVPVIVNDNGTMKQHFVTRRQIG